MRPHRRQPTRLPRPWDSPGKNTGVGCHFLLQFMKVKGKSLSRVQLLATPWTAACQAPPSMGFSRQEYWSGLPLPSLSHSVVFLYLHWSLRKAFLSLLAIHWNSAFKWDYLSFSPLLLASLLFTAICKVSSDIHFAFLHFFSMGNVLIPVSYTMSQTSVHSSSGSLSIRSSPLNLFLTSTQINFWGFFCCYWSYVGEARISDWEY